MKKILSVILSVVICGVLLVETNAMFQDDRAFPDYNEAIHVNYVQDDDIIITHPSDKLYIPDKTFGENSNTQRSSVLQFEYYDTYAELISCDKNASGTVTIPETVDSEYGKLPVTRISYSAFEDCYNITKIIIPDSVTEIGNWAFENCTNLTSITIPDSIVSIGSRAFSGCSSLIYNEYNNGLYLGNSINKYVVFAKANSSDITSCNIYNGTRIILNAAFSNCYNLTSLEIPDSVISLGAYAFEYCTSLSSLKISGNLNEIGWRAFENCTGLMNITIGSGNAEIDPYDLICDSLVNIEVDKNNSQFSSHDGVLYNKDMTELLIYPKSRTETEFTIPDSVIEIYGLAFRGNSVLTTINIGTGVTSIGGYTFENCTGLNSIIIPDNVTEIRSNAFSGCTGLKNIIIGNGVTSIGDYAFYNCTGLTSIEIGNNVISIDYYAFSNCRSLSNVVIGSGLSYLGWEPFDECTALKNIEVDKNNNCYSSVDGVLFNKDVTEMVIFPKSKEVTEYTVPNGVISIGYLLSDCTNLVSVTLPESITELYYSAFSGCTSLKNISLPDNLREIPPYAFSGCTNLESITIPESVTYIGARVFEGCTSLKHINVSNKIQTFDGSALIGCDALEYNEYENGLYLGNEKNEYTVLAGIKNKSITEFNIHVDTKAICSGVFANCENLASIKIPEGITDISDGLFRGCTGLTNIEMGSGVTRIGYSAFNGCTGLTDIVFPESLRIIDDYAFRNCSSLTELDINNNITCIGEGAFEDCTSLVRVHIPDSVTSIVYYAFSGCSNLVEVTIPTSVEEIKSEAFYGCESLEKAYYFGTEEEWDYVYIWFGNGDLTDHIIFHPEHTFGDLIVIKEATLTEDGRTERTCSVCGYTEVTIIEKLSGPGDLNRDGETNNKDVVILFRYVSSSIKDDDESIYDFNKDGEVNNKDVVALFRNVSAS